MLNKYVQPPQYFLPLCTHSLSFLSFFFFFFLLHKSFRGYPGPERKHSIHRCYTGIPHQFPYLLQISTWENNHVSQTGRRGRDAAERLHCLMQDRNSKWKINALQPPQSEVKVNIWEIKPPDFSYKLYTSLRLAEKPSRTITEEERRKIPDFPGKMVHLPSLRNPPKKAISPKFITTFPRLDSHKAKLMFVESGKYPNGVYLNPKPHDFQQVQKKHLILNNLKSDMGIINYFCSFLNYNYYVNKKSICEYNVYKVAAVFLMQQHN